MTSSATVGRLHVLTDTHFQQRHSHADLARLAASGGADTIQFRQKAGTLREKLASLLPAAAVCRELGVTLLVDDHVDLALAAEAQGVHLGDHDLPVAVARQILGDEAIVGGTASTVEEALRVEAEGASYIGFGPVYPTTSKENPKPVRGLRGLEEVCAAVRVPVIAIAGITVDRISDVLGAGAYGVAVMTAVSTATDPVSTTRQLRETIDAALERNIQS